MVAKHSTPELSPATRQRIADFRIEAARLREEFGEPEEALSAFVREHFEEAALAAALEDELAHAADLIDEDEDITEIDG